VEIFYRFIGHLELPEITKVPKAQLAAIFGRSERGDAGRNLLPSLQAATL